MCSLKLGIPSQAEFISVKGANSAHTWSGIIRSRCTENEIDVREMRKLLHMLGKFHSSL